MPELFRALMLGSIEELGNADLHRREEAVRILDERLRYPLGHHWTPEMAVAWDFAFAWRGGLNLASREQIRAKGPLVGLFLTVDSETIDPRVLAKAEADGLTAADRAKRFRGFDFFNEKEHRFPWDWCPDLDNLRAEFHTRGAVIPLAPESFRALIARKRDAWKQAYAEAALRRAEAEADTEEARWDQMELAEMEALEWGGRGGRDFGVGTKKRRPLSRQEEEGLIDEMRAELDSFDPSTYSWMDADPDDARPDYWDPTNPETWYP